MKKNTAFSHSVRVSLTLACCSLSAVGCVGPRMIAPSDIAQGAQVLEVQNRSAATGALVNEDFDLGAHKVTEVDRDWGKKSTVGIGGYEASKTSTGYSYTLKAGSDWNGRCSSMKSDKSAGSISWGGKSRLVCECSAGGKSAVVTLDGDDARNHDKGEVQLEDEKLKVAAVSETDKSNLTGAPAGYRVDSEAGPLGAVETLRPGRVWLGASLEKPQAEALTCLFAGLMLYVPPSEF